MNGKQETHFWLMTVQSNGSVYESHGTCSVIPGETRLDAFVRIRSWFFTELHPGAAGGAVLFFDLQPNKL